MDEQLQTILSAAIMRFLAEGCCERLSVSFIDDRFESLASKVSASESTEPRA
jgi:hypothetical protein